VGACVRAGVGVKGSAGRHRLTQQHGNRRPRRLRGGSDSQTEGAASCRPGGRHRALWASPSAVRIPAPAAGLLACQPACWPAGEATGLPGCLLAGVTARDGTAKGAESSGQAALGKLGLLESRFESGVHEQGHGLHLVERGAWSVELEADVALRGRKSKREREGERGPSTSLVVSGVLPCVCASVCVSWTGLV